MEELVSLEVFLRGNPVAIMEIPLEDSKDMDKYMKCLRELSGQLCDWQWIPGERGKVTVRTVGESPRVLRAMNTVAHPQHWVVLKKFH